MTELDETYLRLCNKLLDAESVNGTQELTNVVIRLQDIENNIISIRNISPSYLFGELLWYFTGRNDLEYISKFSSFWNHLSDDGETCNSAYGYLMMYKHGFNQIEKVIELLKKDPNSRRAVINLNVPNEKVIETKDEPCTIALQFFIRRNELFCTVMMRSNDIWFGLPYDVVFFTELQKYIADRLGVGYGTYTHFATSLHLYDRDAEKIRTIVDDPVSKPIYFDSKAFHKNLDLFSVVVPYCKEPKKDIVRLFEAFDVYKSDTKEDMSNEN